MKSYERAYEIKDQVIKYRRDIHQIAEVGYDLPKTAKYVKDKLIEFGYESKEIIENGIVATVGKGGKTFLLRADMDALPMKEESGLDFASTNGNAHTCGHDMHTAMLLGAAKLLKEREADLKGTVKLMFQPAEELLTGAKKMVDAGVLENPKVDCGLMLHVHGAFPKGIAMKKGKRAASSNNFKITITGKGTHGALPEKGVDPVYIGAKIIIGLQELTTREVSFIKGAVITTGHFEGGSAPNIIPGTAIIQGTMRTLDLETQEHLKKRLPEVVKSIAETYRGSAEVEYLCDVPVLINDVEFTGQINEYIEELSTDKFDVYPGPVAPGSEDFAFVTTQVPGAMLTLGAPDPSGGIQYPLHNSKVIFDEDSMVIGTATFVECATRWLEDNQ